MGGPSEEFRNELVALLPRMRRFAVSLTRSRDTAEDLVQSAVERVLRGSMLFQSGRRMDVWVFRIMRNLWIDNRRAAQSRPVTEELQDFEGDDGRSVVEARDDLRKVRGLYAALPEDQRSVVALVILEGFSYAEAAAALSVPIGTIMSRLSRARSALAKGIEHDGARSARAGTTVRPSPVEPE